MSDPTTNDQGVSLVGITRNAFKAYNAGGPPERANLTHDGRPVPPFDNIGPSVRHKWLCATSDAALAGAAFIIGLVRAGQHDPARLEASARLVLGAPAWMQPIAYDVVRVVAAYDVKGDARSLAVSRTLAEISAFPGVSEERSDFFAAACRALVSRPAADADDKSKARTATLAEWLDMWPNKDPDASIVGAASVWRSIVAGLQPLLERATPDTQARYAAMVDTYRAELDYLDELVSASLRR